MAKRGTASIGQRVMGHSLAEYPTTLTSQSFMRRNSKIIFASDMGGTLMGSIEEALREKFFPALFGGEDINTDFQKILGHSVKHSGLGIPDPRKSSESAYNTSKATSGELVDSLLGGTELNYIGHRACI